MKALVDFLNSNFGGIVSGAIISGLFVQFITSRWQQRSWIFQQQFAAAQAVFDKELEQKHQLLEDINAAVAAVLAHSTFAIAAYLKEVTAEQKNQQISNYNDAVLKWESDFGLYSIRLQTLFTSESTVTKWESIRAQRDKLDVAIYELSDGQMKSSDTARALLETISSLTIELSRQMIADIQEMTSRARIMNDNQEKHDQELARLVHTPRAKHRARKANRSPSS
jgi:L-lactate permease